MIDRFANPIYAFIVPVFVSQLYRTLGSHTNSSRCRIVPTTTLLLLGVVPKSYIRLTSSRLQATDRCILVESGEVVCSVRHGESSEYAVGGRGGRLIRFLARGSQGLYPIYPPVLWRGFRSQMRLLIGTFYHTWPSFVGYCYFSVDIFFVPVARHSKFVRIARGLGLRLSAQQRSWLWSWLSRILPMKAWYTGDRAPETFPPKPK